LILLFVNKISLASAAIGTLIMPGVGTVIGGGIDLPGGLGAGNSRKPDKRRRRHKTLSGFMIR